ncbi:MAG: terpene cyclase/mutase family protein [Planctomycetes bacterium]|nr:terpene cyclase/mutase family protein [Planctomycetota bacterium]
MNKPLQTLLRLPAIAITWAAMVTLPVVALPMQATAQEQMRRGSSNEQLIDDELRESVRRGLDWLQAHQDKDGSWHEIVGYKLNTDYEALDSRPQPHVGVTALALMSFLAGGHLPDRGKYGDVLHKGIDFILSCSQDDGQLTANGTRMYSHAFATLFLAEVYGMVERADVKKTLQRSVDLIVDSQNAEGGWRYRPFARESDMSITVCQVLALRSARNVGIHVPISTIRNAQSYVYRSAVRGNERRYRYGQGAYGDDSGSFRYQNRDQTRATFPLTAAGVTTLYAAGEYDSPIIRDALEYLDRRMPSFNEESEDHYFFYYGHYYAVQAYYITGDPKWTKYFRTMKTLLLQKQRKDGSWPCRAGPGEAFSTAVATLILQIPLQYLPIFQR